LCEKKINLIVIRFCHFCFLQNRPDPKVAYIVGIVFSGIIVFIIPLVLLIKYKCCNEGPNPYMSNQGNPEIHGDDDNSEEDFVVFMSHPSDRVTLTRQNRHKSPVEESCCSCCCMFGRQGRVKMGTSTGVNDQKSGPCKGTTHNVDSHGSPQQMVCDPGATSLKVVVDAASPAVLLASQCTSPQLMAGLATHIVTSTPDDQDKTQSTEANLSDTPGLTLESTIGSDQTTQSPTKLDCVLNLNDKFDASENTSSNAFDSLGQGCVWGAVGGSRSPSPVPLVEMNPKFQTSNKKASRSVESGFDDVARRHGQTPDV
jgi:hypothetical protein